MTIKPKRRFRAGRPYYNRKLGVPYSHGTLVVFEDGRKLMVDFETCPPVAGSRKSYVDPRVDFETRPVALFGHYHPYAMGGVVSAMDRLFSRTMDHRLDALRLQALRGAMVVESVPGAEPDFYKEMVLHISGSPKLWPDAPTPTEGDLTKAIKAVVTKMERGG